MSRVSAAILLLLPHFVASKKVAFSNIWPRHNTTGAIMDAHDGSYNQWGGPGTPFYYYAMGYGTCKQGQDMCHGCGYGYSWVGVWKSTEGMANNSWSLVREARDDTWPRGNGVGAYFRVHTVYNKKTKKYVMWINLSNCNPGCYVVGTSSSPEGPFTYSNPTNGRYSGAGDFDILVDDDGTGYLIYTSTRLGHNMSVEVLTDDYLYSTFDNNRPQPPAPSPSGFALVGHGGCRDGSGKEPSFFTNEAAGGRPPVGARVSEDECIAACAGDDACTALSWAPATSPAEGACHLYVVSQKGPATAPGTGAWTYHASAGNAKDITTVHSGETFWTCLRKDAAAEIDTKSASLNTVSVYDELGESDGAPAPNSSGFIGTPFVEAPAIFKRKGVYYALFGKCCCFCGHGSGAGVYTSVTSPLGPWTYHDNIGCLPTAEGVSSTCGCGMNNVDKQLHCPDLYGQSATKAQQNYVFPVTSSTGEVTWVWTGDMWQSARSGLKSEDRQFWTPLTFVKDPKSGLELPLQINSTLDTFELDIV